VKVVWAEWFMKRGFAIFPVDPNTKKAVIKEWQRFSVTPLSDQEREQYLKMVGDGYNYAVPGGQHGLVVLDFEGESDFTEELNEMCARTLCVSTPHNGVHVYVISEDIPPHKFNPLFTKDGKGVADLQSFNSYVVGPGSCINHKSCTSDKCPWRGQDKITCYTPINNNEIGKVDLRGLLKFLAERGKKAGIELSNSALTWVSRHREEESLREEMAKYDRFRGKTVEAVKEEVCGRLKEKLERRRVKHLKTTFGVVCENKTYHELGVDRSSGDWHVLTTLLSMGVTNLTVLEQLLPKDSKVFAPKWDKYYVHTLMKAWNYSKATFQAEGKDAKKIMKSVITNAVLQRFKVKTFYTRTGHNQAIIGVFVWNKKKGVFVPFDKELRKAIRTTAEVLGVRSEDKSLAFLSKRDVDDIFDEIRDSTLTPMPKEPLRIAFRNGTLEWTETGVKWYDVKERTSKEYAFYYLPFELKFEEIEELSKKEITVEDVEQLARRLCPKSLDAFKSWVDEKWVLLFEVLGYTLYPEVKFRKAFMLVGEGKNGKSTFVNLVKELLGKYAEDISPRELFDSQNRFIVSNLYHKLVNAVAESKDYTIEDMDRFKRLTGGDWFTADVKFKDPITFRNIAKLIVASNNMPYLRDTNDKAFWHRWVIVEFPHHFPDDDTWFRRTFTGEEKDGIITVSLLAFMRVIQHKAFDFEQNEKEVMDIWLSKTDSVYSFVSKSIKEGVLKVDPKNGDLWVTRTELYRLYRDYCIDQGFRGVGRKSFARKLREYFGITTVTKNVEGKRMRAFVGIKVVTEAPFFEYVKRFNGTVKEFWEIVHDFDGDKVEANKFTNWCKTRGFCYQRGIDRWEIRTY